MTAAEKPNDDPCAGCVKRRTDGNHEWACLECKRWWPDKYEPERRAQRLPLLGVSYGH